MAEIPFPGGAPIPNPGPSTAYLSQLSGQYAGARAVTQPEQPMVYLGADRVSSPIRGAGATFRDPEPSFTPREASISQAMLDFEALDKKEKREVARRLALGGMLGSPYQGETLDEFVRRTTLADVQAAYGSLLESAANRYAAGQEITPDALLQQHIDYNQQAGGAFAGQGDGSGGSGGSGSPYANKTLTTTSTQRDIYSREEAEGLARAILRRELDRDPTDEEYEDFVAALQTKQRENPTITTTRTSYDEFGSVANSSSTTRGGVDLEQFAQEQAEENPDYATWQAIGTFLPALFQELGSGVPNA